MLKATNRLAEAEPLLRRALNIDEQSFGTDHPKVATGLNNLAQLLQDTNRLRGRGRGADAPRPRIDEQSFGTERIPTSPSASTIWRSCSRTRTAWQAEPLMRRALKIDEQSFGPNHPDVARDLNLTWRSCSKATNRLARPSRCCAAPSKLMSELWLGYPKVATDLNNLALLLKATNRLAEAEPLLRRALKIDEQSFGPLIQKSPETSTTWRSCSKPRIAWQRPSRCCGGLPRSLSAVSAPIIPMR
ncbi:MAG: tetratricopeptide repeat protein [Acidobacteriota bacterium]